MKRLLLILLALAAGFSAFGQDSLTVETAGGQLSKIEYSWTSDGSGAAVGVTTTVVPGAIYSVSTTPDTVAVPTDNYDIVLQNVVPTFAGTDTTLSTDRAGGLLANRDSVNAELVEFWPSGIYTSQGKLKITISNAGASKSGKVVVTVHRNLNLNGFTGAFAVPPGNTLGTIAQWGSPGTPKWVTVSGDATIEDGGNIEVAPGDGEKIEFGDGVDYGLDYNAADDSLRVTKGGTTFAKFVPTWSAGVTGNTFVVAERTGDTISPGLWVESDDNNLGAKIVLNIDDDGNNIGHIQWRGDANKLWDMNVTGNDSTHMDWNYSDTDQRVFRLEDIGKATVTAVANSGTAWFVADSNSFTNTTAKFSARVTADGSQAQHTWELPTGAYWNAYMVGSSPNVWHLFRSSEGGGANADQITVTGGSDVTFANQIRGPTLLSSVATGTAPFTVTSTTKVSNLNVDQVDGGDWASPGAAIGTGTPVAGTFTTLNASGTVSLTGNPVTLNATSTNTALNGNAVYRVTAISSDTDHSGSTNLGRMDIAANGNQTQTHPNGLFIWYLGSGSAAMAEEMRLGAGGLTLADANDITVGSTTGTKFPAASTQKWGAWGVTPVVQPSTTGTTTGFTANVSTPVLVDSTFTGGTGSKAYTIGDIVLALKQAGIMAAS